MKKKYSTLPESMKNMEMYGFNWMEFVISVPSPLYIMTLKNMEMYGFNWMEFVISVPSPLYIMTLRSTAHLIIEFPKEGGFENASNL